MASTKKTKDPRGSGGPGSQRGRVMLPPITPGELLWAEFMEPIGLTKYRLAKEIGVPPQRIGAIVAGKRTITADTDLRLCKYFGLSDGYWLRAQAAHDLEVTRRDLWEELGAITPLPRPTS